MARAHRGPTTRLPGVLERLSSPRRVDRPLTRARFHFRPSPASAGATGEGLEMVERATRVVGIVVVAATVVLGAGCGSSSSNGQLPKNSDLNQSKTVDCANSGGLPGFKNGKQICNTP